MKLACCSYSYHRTFAEGKMNQLEWIKLCADQMYDGVELLDMHFPNTEEGYLKQVVKLCVDLQLTIVCMAVCDEYDSTDDFQLRRSIESTKGWIDIAQKVKTPLVRVLGGRIKGDPETAWKRMISALKECVSYGEDKGIMLALENHGGFTETADSINRVLKEVGSEWLRVNIDTGNYAGDPYVSLKKNINQAVYFHARLSRLNKEGVEQTLDYDRIFEILRKADYRGFVGIEYEGEEDEIEAMKKGIRFMRRYIP